jgi:hypothetical protein
MCYGIKDLIGKKTREETVVQAHKTLGELPH